MDLDKKLPYGYGSFIPVDEFDEVIGLETIPPLPKDVKFLSFQPDTYFDGYMEDRKVVMALGKEEDFGNTIITDFTVHVNFVEDVLDVPRTSPRLY